MASDDEKARATAPECPVCSGKGYHEQQDPRDNFECGPCGGKGKLGYRAILSALADARAEGRREMRDEAANAASTCRVGWAAARAIRALPIATQATAVVAENASTQVATSGADAREETSKP